MKLTSDDVMNADRYAARRTLSAHGAYHQDMADFLNARIETTFTRSWRRYGYALLFLGFIGCLAAVMLAMSTEHLELGVLGTVLGFIVAVIGHGMTEE